LQLYDIVLGTSAVSLGAFKSPYRAAGAGSNPLDWKPLNLMASEGSAGNDPRAQVVARFRPDEALLAAARSVKHDELDLVARYHSEYGTSVEEMETASAAQIAGLFGIPFLGIRVLSDNVTNGEPYDPKTGEACEDYVLRGRQGLRTHAEALRR
jgi:adenosylhomocysteine nucleosidase